MNPGEPDCRGPGRFLWWLAVMQRRRIALSSVIGTVWMLGVTIPPYLLARAIDSGLQAGDFRALLEWTGALLAVGLITAAAAMLRHRTMTRVRMDASFRTAQLLLLQVTRVGAAMARQISAGEVVTIGMGDVQAISWTLTMAGPGVGSVVSCVVVAILLFSVSAGLAVVVLVGVAALAVIAGPLVNRLQRRQAGYRQLQSGLAARFTDIAGGLRVLNGIGGKDVYAARYRRESQALQREGYRVGAVSSWVEALGTGLPAVFLAVVTWLAARMAAQGTISVGQLVSVYGYVAVLTLPFAQFIESGYQLAYGLVAARRVLRVLALEPDFRDDDASASAPAEPSVLQDPVSGVHLEPGRFLGLVSARPAESAAVVDRLGRFTGGEVLWGSVPLESVPVSQARRRILVADNDAALFAGSVRAVVGGDDVAGAIEAAAADDVVSGLDGGIDAPLDPDGRNLSGGQRQRIRLARAIAADPEVLLAVEPTSAVDVHTEAAMADRLRSSRRGRTTLVTASSPILLDRTDEVQFLVEGQVVARGPHRDLLHQREDYRAVVSRGEAS